MKNRILSGELEVDQDPFLDSGDLPAPEPQGQMNSTQRRDDSQRMGAPGR